MCDIWEKWVRWAEAEKEKKGEIWEKWVCDIWEKWVRWAKRKNPEKQD